MSQFRSHRIRRNLSGRGRPHAAPGAPAGASRALLAAAALLAWQPTATAGQPSAAASAARVDGWAPGRVLVQPRAGLSDGEFDAVLRTHGARSGGRLRGLGIHMVQLPPGASEHAAAAALARHPHVKFAEVDRKVAAAAVPNDPYFGGSWHLARINAPAAWDVATGAGVRIAVLDSGVDAAHPDLAAQIVPGWNMIDNNFNTADVHGHGTAVAGAAAAAMNNAAGGAGVAGAARIMPVRIADANAYAYWSTVAQGLTWAADNGARVANISYSGVTGSSTVQSAAQYLKGKGGLVVVSAGNAGVLDATAPTGAMITVSATDAGDALAGFSSYGGFVDVAAPGVDIWTSTAGGGYAPWWGTSLASPVVAGTVALMMAARPGLQAADYEQALVRSAVDLGAPGPDAQFGHGRIDAAAAVRAAASFAAADTAAPTAQIASPAGGTVRGLVAVDVSATDNVGVVRVDLFVNAALLGSDTSAPFGFSWDTTRLRDGPAVLSAVAYDAAGNASAPAKVELGVANATPAGTVDTIAPTVAITGPADGSVVSGNVTIAAAADDNLGAAQTRLALYLDGALKATGNGTVSYAWNTRKSSKGVHTVTVTATDAAGNVGTAQAQVTAR